MSEALPIDGLRLSRSERALHVWSDEPLTVLSSAVVGGELRQTRHIVNMHVQRGAAHRSPEVELGTLARELGIAGPFVGLMTGVDLKRAQVIVEREAQATTIAIVTVGISHPTAAGVTEAFRGEVGTINIIVIADARLSHAARVNAVITATEAKTLALVEAGVRALHGGFASGSGSDAIVIATTERGTWFEYAGPIAPVGALIGRAVRRAVQNALRR